MAGKKLKVSVTVRDPETGEATVYQAGDTPSADDAKLITNPDVWDEGDDDEEEPVPGDGQFTAVSDEEIEENAKPVAAPKAASSAKAAPTPAPQK